MTYAEALEAWRREYLATLITKHHGNVADMAREMGMQRTNVSMMITRAGVRDLLTAARPAHARPETYMPKERRRKVNLAKAVEKRLRPKKVPVKIPVPLVREPLDIAAVRDRIDVSKPPYCWS